MNVAERVPTAGLRVRRQLLAREPGWQLSLMLALEVVFLFVATPTLSTGGVDRSVVTLLQLLLAGIAAALLAGPSSPPDAGRQLRAHLPVAVLSALAPMTDLVAAWNLT